MTSLFGLSDQLIGIQVENYLENRKMIILMTIIDRPCGLGFTKVPAQAQAAYSWHIKGICA